MDPSSLTGNSGTMPIWSGVTEDIPDGDLQRPVDQLQHPVAGRSSAPLPVHRSRLCACTWPSSSPMGRTWGTLEPQGLGDFAEAEVTDPVPGRWTALFFTELDGATPPQFSGHRPALSSGTPRPAVRAGRLDSAAVLYPSRRAKRRPPRSTQPAHAVTAGDSDPIGRGVVGRGPNDHPGRR